MINKTEALRCYPFKNGSFPSQKNATGISVAITMTGFCLYDFFRVPGGQKDIHPRNLTWIPRIASFQRESPFPNHHFGALRVSFRGYTTLQEMALKKIPRILFLWGEITPINGLKYMGNWDYIYISPFITGRGPPCISPFKHDNL